MNTHKYLKRGAIVPVTMDAIRDLVELGKQQADRIAELEKQTKPLSDEEIRHIQAICHLKDVGYDNFIMRFARAIEERHGRG